MTDRFRLAEMSLGQKLERARRNGKIVRQSVQRGTDVPFKGRNAPTKSGFFDYLASKNRRNVTLLCRPWRGRCTIVVRAGRMPPLAEPPFGLVIVQGYSSGQVLAAPVDILQRLPRIIGDGMLREADMPPGTPPCCNPPNCTWPWPPQ